MVQELLLLHTGLEERRIDRVVDLGRIDRVADLGRTVPAVGLGRIVQAVGLDRTGLEEVHKD